MRSPHGFNISSPDTCLQTQVAASRAGADGLILRPRFRPSSVTDVGSHPENSAANALPDLLAYADLERLFGRTERTLRRWIAQGHLDPVQVGRSVFFHGEDIRRLLSTRLLGRVMGRAVGRSDPASHTKT